MQPITDLHSTIALLSEIIKLKTDKSVLPFNTARTYLRYANSITGYCRTQNIAVSDLTEDDLDNWVRVNNWKPSGRNAAISALRWCASHASMDIPALKRVSMKREHREQQLLSLENLQAMRRANEFDYGRRSGKRSRAMVLLMLDTAASTKELQSMLVEDIKLQDGYVLINSEKRAIKDDTQDAFVEYLNWRVDKYTHCGGDELLFYSEHKGAVSAVTIWRAIAANIEATCKNVTISAKGGVELLQNSIIQAQEQ